jgi:hypothetical protein
MKLEGSGPVCRARPDGQGHGAGLRRSENQAITSGTEGQWAEESREPAPASASKPDPGEILLDPLRVVG